MERFQRGIYKWIQLWCHWEQLTLSSRKSQTNHNLPTNETTQDYPPSACARCPQSCITYTSAACTRRSSFGLNHDFTSHAKFLNKTIARKYVLPLAVSELETILIQNLLWKQWHEKQIGTFVERAKTAVPCTYPPWSALGLVWWETSRRFVVSTGSMPWCLVLMVCGRFVLWLKGSD